MLLDLPHILASTWFLPLATPVAALALREYYYATQRRREAVCGNCSYSIYGLPSTVCPECGADLTQAGVRRPGLPAPRRGTASFAVWTLGWSGTLWTTSLLAACCFQGLHWGWTLPLVLSLAAYIVGLLHHPPQDVADASLFLAPRTRPPVPTDAPDSVPNDSREKIRPPRP